MGKREKLIAKFQKRPPEVRFSEVEQLLEFFGYTLERQESSHCVFSKPGAPPINVPQKGGRKVGRRYIDQICKMLDLDGE